MRILTIVFCLFLTACVTDPVSRVQWDLSRDFMGRKSLFTEIQEWEPLQEINGVLYGDCSNFAVSAKRELQKIGVKGQIAIAYLRANDGTSSKHAFVITPDNRVLDSNLALPTQLKYYRNRLVDQHYKVLPEFVYE